MCFITHLNNNKFHIKVYLVISSELDLQSSKCLGVPSHPMFPYSVFVMWRALQLHRLGRCILELVPTPDKPGMLGTDGIWCQREGTVASRKLVVPWRQNQECPVPMVYKL